MPNKKNRKNITTVGNIVKMVKRWRRRGLKIVTTNGAFDILHIGHVYNLEFAKSLGDILIVGVNSDASVRAYKGPRRPIVRAAERVKMISALKSVDYAFIFNEKTPIPWLKKILPDIHVKGGDRKLGQIIEREALKKLGVKLVLAPFIKDKSSTKIIEKINKIYG